MKVTMPNDLKFLRKTLEASVHFQGEVPLTNSYLLNIIDRAIRLKEFHEDQQERILTEIFNDTFRDG